MYLFLLKQPPPPLALTYYHSQKFLLGEKEDFWGEEGRRLVFISI